MLQDNLCKHGRRSLRIHIDGYLESLAANRYADSTRDHYRTDLTRFIAYAETKGIYLPGGLQRMLIVCYPVFLRVVGHEDAYAQP